MEKCEHLYLSQVLTQIQNIRSIEWVKSLPKIKEIDLHLTVKQILCQTEAKNLTHKLNKLTIIGNRNISTGYENELPVVVNNNK